MGCSRARAAPTRSGKLETASDRARLTVALHAHVHVRNSRGLPATQRRQGRIAASDFTKKSAQQFGPLHVAAALNVNIICITNFPPAEMICLPALKDIDQVESEWFYPQSVILHQDGEGPFVKQLSLENLQRALDGDLYPYWSDRYLPLIKEQLK
jgi:hypothetical protein